MLSLRTHNVLDYVAGLVLIVAPAVFGFGDVDAARNLFLVLGFGLIAYSMMTRYYYSIAKLIPLRTHMVMDVASGVAILLAPFAFGYRDALGPGQFIAHMALGFAPILLVLSTTYRGEVIGAGRGADPLVDARRKDRAA